MAVAAVTMSLTAGVSSAAPVLTTKTTVVSSANPAVSGAPVRLTATVSIGTSNLGPVTPKGTVTFRLNGVQQGAPVPLSACAIGITPCTAAKTVTAPLEVDGPTTVTATYNGDVLSKPSSGMLTQYTNDPVDCPAGQVPCYNRAYAANNLSYVQVVTKDASPNTQTAEASFQTAPLSCATSGTGDTGVVNVTGDPSVTKRVVYELYGSAAQAGAADLYHVCWGSDSSFLTATGQPAPFVNGEFEGTLPRCFADDVSAPPPCVYSANNYPNEGGGFYLSIVVDAPGGDPKVIK